MNKIVMAFTVASASLLFAGCFKSEGDLTIKTAEKLQNGALSVDGKKIDAKDKVTLKVSAGTPHTVRYSLAWPARKLTVYTEKQVTVPENGAVEVAFTEKDLSLGIEGIRKNEAIHYEYDKDHADAVKRFPELVGKWTYDVPIKYSYKHSTRALVVQENGTCAFDDVELMKDVNEYSLLTLDEKANTISCYFGQRGDDVVVFEDYKFTKDENGGDCIEFSSQGGFGKKNHWTMCKELSEAQKAQAKKEQQKKIEAAGENAYAYVLNVVKNGSKRGTPNTQGKMVGMKELFNANTGQYLTEAEAETVSLYVANGMKGSGKEIFMGTCALCHGRDGRGFEYTAPDIHDLAKKYANKGFPDNR